jgi:hypothetical protein
MYFHPPNAIKSAKDVSAEILKDFEQHVASPDSHFPPIYRPSAMVDYEPASLSFVETTPQNHNQKLYQTWSQYLIWSMADTNRNRNILIASTYRRSAEILEYAISHMAEFDMSLSGMKSLKKASLLKLKRTIDDTTKLPLFFTDLDETQGSPVDQLIKATNEAQPGLIIVDHISALPSQTSPVSMDVQNQLRDLSLTHSLAVAFISLQENATSLSRG